MIDAFTVAASRPWLIQAEALESILTIAQRHGDPEALEAKLGRPLDNARSVTMRDGIAVIPVTGPVFRYANLFTRVSGATSTQDLSTDIQAALDNPYVRGIVLEFNTPGGEATAINELADMIHAGRARKPIKAYVDGAAASAGYWLASATDEIIVSETAILGSIGTVMSWTDARERDAKNGVRQIEIVSSQSPFKRVDAATDEGRAKVQAIVDALTDVFVSAVARYRNVSTDTVLADFGQGGVLVGRAAVTAGMADRIGSLETVIAELAGSASTTTRSNTMSSKSGQVTVSSTDDLRQALAAGYSADQIIVASQDDAIAAARAEGVAEGKASASETIVAGERARIAKLQSLARAGFDTELQAAIDTGATPEAFALALIEAAADRGVTLDAIRKDAPPAAAHGGKADDSAAPTAAAKSLTPQEIFAKRRQSAAQAKTTHV